MGVVALPSAFGEAMSCDLVSLAAVLAPVAIVGLFILANRR